MVWFSNVQLWLQPQPFKNQTILNLDIFQFSNVFRQIGGRLPVFQKADFRSPLYMKSHQLSVCRISNGRSVRIARSWSRSYMLAGILSTDVSSHCVLQWLRPTSQAVRFPRPLRFPPEGNLLLLEVPSLFLIHQDQVEVVPKNTSIYNGNKPKIVVHIIMNTCQPFNLLSPGVYTC